jgi:diguanylate cyclase (GGDEF)-like protein
MSRPGFLAKKTNKPVASIQQQYIKMAVILGSFVIVVATVGYLDMVKKSTALVSQMQMISSLLDSTNQLRNYMNNVKHAIDTFMLEPERTEQKQLLSNQLDQANSLLDDLKNNAIIQSLNVQKTLNKIHNEIYALKNYSSKLFQIRVSANQQYPALQISSTIMLPSRNEIFSILELTIAEYQNSELSSENFEVYNTLIDTQKTWITTIAEYRLYMANRIGSFNEQGLREQETNIVNYIEQLQTLSSKLNQYSQASFLGFEGTELVTKLPDHLQQWYRGFMEVMKINHSNRWRQDSQIMKEIIVPLLNEIDHSLVMIDEKINAEKNMVLNRLSRSGATQTLVLAGVILLFLLYISISIISLKKLIIKPIALIASTLKNKALGLHAVHTLSIKQTRETQDLLQAFDEMNQQIIQRQNALEEQALSDTLTGLPNRLKLKESLNYQIRISQREKFPLILMMLDLNRFKEVNDTLGHHIGDQLLIQVGKRLQKALRDTDTVARLGGDEFAIILPYANKENAVEIANKINRLIEAPFKIHSYSLRVSISIGISEYPHDGDNMNVLMQYADVAMYTSKKKKNAFSFYDPSADLHSIERLSLGSELHLAMEEQQLALYFQPKHHLDTGLLTGAEALIRWQHPKQGFISPDLIIETAEQMGFINELSYWVIENAISQCAECHNNHNLLNIAINLSVHNLRDQNLVEKIKLALEKNRLSSQHLTLEVTESAMMTSPEQSIEILTQLNQLGITISIDDFGTGFSSLAYLKQLPVKEIKIDKSFVIDMQEDSNDAVIVRSTIDLGHNLGLNVVAEGVEDQSIWNMLKAMNCDMAQGYHLGRPMKAEDFKVWLRDKRLHSPGANTIS